MEPQPSYAEDQLLVMEAQDGDVRAMEALDWLKKNRCLTRSIQDYPEPTSPETADLGLLELLPKLDLKKRLVLSLFYLEQLTIPEISAALGIPSGTVKSRLHNARQELKELWQHDIEGDSP